MNEIILKKMEIHNFRGLKDISIEFGPAETVICGDNATGKSTIFAAFCWCLFGKDEKDRKDYEIKPARDGKAIGRTRTCVTVTLDTDGGTTELRREFYEKWVKHRGDSEDTFEGNETACWWNGAPVSVTDYEKRLASIIDTNIFKMLSNPAFFPNMKWQEQRAILLRLVPEVTDEQLAAGDKEILAMLAEQSGKTAKDFRSEKTAALKRLRKEKEGIEPRIDEVGSTIVQVAESREELERQMEDAKAESEAIGKEMTSIAAGQEALLKKIEAKRKEAEEFDAQAGKLVAEARANESQRVVMANAGRKVKTAELSALERKIETETNYIIAFDKQTETYTAERDKLIKDHAALSQEYIEESSKTFNPQGMCCPACGRPMSNGQLDEAAEEFNAKKAAKLKDIVERGTKLKERIEAAEKVLAEREEKFIMIERERDTDADKREQLKSEIAAIPEIEHEHPVVPENIQGWNELKQKAEALRKEMHGIEAQGSDAAARKEAAEKLNECNTRINEIAAKLKDHDNNDKAEARIAELNERGRELAQQIAEYERMELAAQRLEKLRFEDVERHINGLFHHVTFKLFDQTIEGKSVDACVAVVGDALYPVANSADKLNAGLDIIHTLSGYFGFRCPIFIDNAEGCTNIDGHGMQLVKLYVKAGSKLEIQ